MASDGARGQRPEPRSRGRLKRDAPGGLIPGVPNAEARQAFDLRVEFLRAAAEADDRSALERDLCEARLMGLWRARAITGFEAFAADVLGIEPDRALALSEAGRQALGLEPERLPDGLVALWLRTELSLRRHCREASVHLTREGGLRLMLALPVDAKDDVLAALVAVGKRAAALQRQLD